MLIGQGFKVNRGKGARLELMRRSTATPLGCGGDYGDKDGIIIERGLNGW